MQQMSAWEADAPGRDGTWWSQRKRYFPIPVAREFDLFVSRLNQFNNTHAPNLLEQLTSAAADLIYALENNRVGPKLTARNRVAILFAPNLKSSTTARSPTDNAITAVKNLIQSLGGQFIPRRYEV